MNSYPWSAVLSDQKKCWATYLFICWYYYICISKVNWVANELLKLAPVGMLVRHSLWTFQEAYSCNSLMALTSRLHATFSSVSTLFSPIWCSVQAIAEGKNRLWNTEMGGTQRWVAEPRLLWRSSPVYLRAAESVRVCGPRALAGLTLCLVCLPATCRLDVMRGKVRQGNRDLLFFKKTTTSPCFPFPPPCSLGQILPCSNVCLFRGGEREVIWAHCLLFNH